MFVKHRLVTRGLEVEVAGKCGPVKQQYESWISLVSEELPYPDRISATRPVSSNVHKWFSHIGTHHRPPVHTLCSSRPILVLVFLLSSSHLR